METALSVDVFRLEEMEEEFALAVGARIGILLVDEGLPAVACASLVLGISVSSLLPPWPSKSWHYLLIVVYPLARKFWRFC